MVSIYGFAALVVQAMLCLPEDDDAGTDFLSIADVCPAIAAAADQTAITPSSSIVHSSSSQPMDTSSLGQTSRIVVLQVCLQSLQTHPLPRLSNASLLLPGG